MSAPLKDKVLLCVGVQHSKRRQEVIAAARGNGNYVIVLKFPGDRINIEHADEYIDVGWHSYQTDFADQHDGRVIDVIFTFNDIHVERVSRLAERVNPTVAPYPLKVAINCTDKLAMKTALCEANVPTCPFKQWSNRQEFIDAIQTLGLTDKHFILKPRLGTGSLGVYHREPDVSIDQAYLEFHQLCQHGAHSPIGAEVTAPPFIIEPYIDRYSTPVELAVEGHIVNGVATVMMVSEKMAMVKSGPFLKNRYVSPPISDFVQRDLSKIAPLAQATCDSLKLNNSVFHLELRYDNEELLVLEVGARPGGVLICPSCELRTDVNLYEQHLRVVSGVAAMDVRDLNTATAFGTIYYQDGFNLRNMPLVQNHLDQKEHFYDLKPNPENRLHALDDWLVSFGVISDSAPSAYQYYQNEADALRLMLKHTVNTEAV